MLKHREAILTLFLKLAESPRPKLQKFKKVAPFLVQDIRGRLQSTQLEENGEVSNGLGSSASYLSSILEIRHQVLEHFGLHLLGFTVRIFLSDWSSFWISSSGATQAQKPHQCIAKVQVVW